MKVVALAIGISVLALLLPLFGIVSWSAFVVVCLGVLILGLILWGLKLMSMPWDELDGLDDDKEP